ncbi:hypothetical protein KEM54_003412 [Ascosphaera aggregata]|nr:hypothetical protein KEM54_003412 [Ascosphaera aggregata]
MASKWIVTDVASPSLPQLALALSIIKTKPLTLGIRDDLDKRIDSITFWRQAYEKSEAAQARQLDRIYDLEQENASLRMKRDCGGVNVFNVAAPGMTYRNGSGKRKVTLLAGASTRKGSQAPSSKRIKTMCDQSIFDSQISLTNSVSLDVPSFKSVFAVPLLRHFCALQTSLQQRKSSATGIANSCIALSQAAVQAITGAVENAVKSAEDQSCQLPEVLVVIANCYPFIVKGVVRVRSIEGGDTPISRTITYHIVQLFRSILDQMERYVMSSASIAVRTELASDKKRKKPRSRTVKTRAYTATLPSPRVQSIIQCFTQLISCLISSGSGLEACSNPLEGFLFYLLHSAGRKLSQFTFHELQTDPALRIDSNKVTGPAITPDLQTSGSETRLAAEWTAKYLIYLLNQALPLAKEHSAMSVSERTTAPNLMNHGKLKLQRTLLQAVFGTEGDFKDGLTIPDKHTFRGQTINDESGDVSEWFTQELWKLVGWDVLLKEKLI